MENIRLKQLCRNRTNSILGRLMKCRIELREPKRPCFFFEFSLLTLQIQLPFIHTAFCMGLCHIKFCRWQFTYQSVLKYVYVFWITPMYFELHRCTLNSLMYFELHWWFWKLARRPKLKIISKTRLISFTRQIQLRQSSLSIFEIH